MTALPATVTVGPHRYAVGRDEHSTQVCLAVDSHCVGRTVHSDLAIHLRADLAPSFERETTLHEVLHEVLHSVCSLAGLQGDDDLDPHEERIVAALAPALLQVLRDNPGLLAYLTADEG